MLKRTHPSASCLAAARFLPGDTMVITKIESQKKHKNRSSVYIDGSFAFGISDFDLMRFHLCEGKTLDNHELETLRQEVLAQDARQYALKLLDRQNYTEKALVRKMAEHGCEPVAIEHTLVFLKEYQYINDYEYARQYIAAALRAGKSGVRKIKFDLTAKGIDAAIFDEVIAELNDEDIACDEEEAVRVLLEKKLRGDHSFPNLMKAKRYCLSRGFSSDTIDRVLYTLKNNDEEWFDA